MAGTMAFYNGMMPGITEMVKSLSGDEAARRGYAKAAQAEHDIAGARKANVEAQIKQKEYDDTDKNAMSYVLGQHGISAPDFNAYRRRQEGAMEPGGRDFTPEEATKFNAALRDYGAFKTGKFHDVSQGATEFARQPAVQTSVRAAQDFSKAPGRTAAEIIQMNQAALGKDVMKDSDHTPNDVRVWNWLQSQPAEVQRAYHAREMQLRQAGAAQGAQVMTPVPMVGPDGKTVYGYPSKRGADIQPTTAVVPGPESKGPQSPVGKLMQDMQSGYIKAPGQKPAAAPAASPAEAPPAPSAGQRKPGAIYNTPKGPMKWTGTGWVAAQ